MSYNNRRPPANSNFNNGMGRGRPNLQQNFVPGGQYQQKAPRPGGPRLSGPRPQGPAQPPQQQQPQQQQPFLRQPHTPLPPAPLKSALKKEVKNETNANVGGPNQPTVGNNPPIGQQIQQQQQQPKPNVQQPPKPNVQQQQPPKPNVQQPNVQSQQSVPSQPGQQNSPTQNLPTQPNAQPQPNVQPSKMEVDVENGDTKKKSLIFKNKFGKISKKEKRGRRNRRLRKILVPKNALMVLNELVGGQKFTFLDKGAAQNFYHVDPETYCASVTIEGVEHIGYGKSKTAAKTAAAENALRHIILSKISTPLSASQSSTSLESEEVPMEVEGGEKQEEEDVSWLHVASFAMHKLFSSWYMEGDEKLDQISGRQQEFVKEQIRASMETIKAELGVTAADGQAKAVVRNNAPDLTAKLQEIKPFQVPAKTRKPAKQLPQNPHQLNPVMLLNQMRDDVTYEEHSKSGTTPHIMFIIKATVDGLDFYGKGSNKKIARKNCAYAACMKIYNVVYPPEEVDPTMCSEGVPLF